MGTKASQVLGWRCLANIMTENNKQKYIDEEQCRRITWLEDRYSNFNKEMGQVQQDIAQIKTDIKWIKRLSFAILPILAGTVVSLIYIIIEHV